MKAKSPKPMKKMSMMKTDKFKPMPMMKKASQMKALRNKMDMSGMDSNGQPKAKRGKQINSID